MTAVKRGMGKRAALAATALAALLFFSLFFVSIDLSSERAAVEAAIESRINGRIEMDSITLKVLPVPQIRLRGLRISDDSGVVIGTKALRVNVELVPLLWRRAVIKSLDVEGGDLLLKRLADGRVNIAEIFRERLFDVTLGFVRLKGCRLGLVDEPAGFVKPLVLTGLNGRIYPGESGLAFRAEADLEGGGRMELSGDVRLEEEEGWSAAGALRAEGVAVRHLAPLLSRRVPWLRPEGAVEVEGTYNLERRRLLIKGTVGYSGAAVAVPGLKGPLRSGGGRAAVEFLWSGGRSRLWVREATVEIGGGELRGRLSMDGFGAKGRLAVEAEGGPFALKPLLARIDGEGLAGRTGGPWKEAELTAGTVTVRSLDLETTFAAVRDGSFLDSLFVDTVVSGVVLRHGRLSAAVTDAGGAVSFKGGTLFVKDFSAGYGRSRLRDLDGVFSGPLGPGSFRVDVDARLAADETVAELARVFGHRPWVSGLTADGDFALKMRIEGGGARPVRYKGRVMVKDFTPGYAGVVFPVRPASGEVSFDNERIVIEGLRGGLERTELTVSGEISGYLEGRPDVDMDISGELSGGEVVRLLKMKRDVPVELDGPIPFSMRVDGRFGALRVRPVADLTAASLEIPGFVRKAASSPLSLTAEAVVRDDGVVIERAAAAFGESVVTVGGTVAADLSSYELDVNSGKVTAADLESLSPSFGLAAGGEAAVSLKVSSRRGEAPALEGEVSVRDGYYRSPALPAPLREIKARAVLSGRSAAVTVDNVTAGSSRLKGRIDILDIEKKVVDFTVSSPRVDFSDFVGAGGGPGMSVTGRGRVEIGSALVRGRELTDLAADVSLDRERVRLEGLSFGFHGGTVRGDAVYYRDPSEPRLWGCRLHFEGVDLEALVSELGAKEPVFSGRLDGAVDLAGKRWEEVPVRGLEGSFELRSEGGRLWRFVILNKIFSIVNIVSIEKLFEEGLPYDRVGGRFTVRRGVIRTEDLLLESDSMRMSAVGSIDLAGRTVDAKLGFHPFVTIDKIVTKIPIAGWIIGGKEKSTISMYYEIKGPFEGIEVRPIPVKALGEGLLGIFRRLLEAPIRPFRPEREAEEGK